jgi:DNA-binding NarL/FixJ family response regulator
MIMIKIVLADDNIRILNVIEHLLNDEADMHVLGIAHSGSEALELSRINRPDVLITDIVMYGMNGIQLIQEVLKELPGIKSLVLSMHDNDTYVQQALEAGASGYVLKGRAGTDLIPAIHNAMSGKIFLSPPSDDKKFVKYARRGREK